MSDDADVMSKGRVLGFGAYLIVLNLALLYILTEDLARDHTSQAR